MHSKILFLAPLVLLSGISHAGAAELTSDQVDVVGLTPLQSTGTPINEIPSNVQVIKSEQINKQKSSNITDLLNDNLGSVNISNGTGSPYQPDIEYRGFTASPQLGQPAGLSVYLDGMRVNEPLGEVVNWDLIPMNAISGINLMPGSNPLYGLNTLGGSLAVFTKNGADYPGFSFTQSFGSWGGHQTQFESGGEDKTHNLDYFVSGNFFEQNGWRKETNTDVNQLFGKIRWHNDSHVSNLDLSFGFANNLMHQGQALPSSMMDNPSQVYTGPDYVKNQMGFINLKGSTLLSETRLLEGNAYFRRSNSQAMNSNARAGGLICASLTPNASGSKLNDDGSCPTGMTKAYAGWTSTATGFGASLKTSGWRKGGLFDNDGLAGAPIEASNTYSSTRQTSVGLNLEATDTSKWFKHDNSLTLGGGYEVNYVKYSQLTKAAFMKPNGDPTTYDYQYNSSKQDTVGGDNSLPNDGILDQVTLRSRTYNTGIFAADTFDVTNKLKALASARFQVSQIRLGGQDNDYWDTDRYEEDPGGNQTLQSTSLSGRHTYSRLNPSLGLTYTADNTLNIYGGYSEGMRAPNAMELECSNPDRPCTLPVGFTADPELKKVVAKTWEVGARGRLARSWFWNLGLFNTNNYNDIIYASNGNTGYFSNVGMTNRRGVELGLAGIYEKLSLVGRYSFVDATYQSNFDMGTNSALADNGVEHVKKGNEMPGVARHTFKLRTDYAITPNWDVGGNAVFASSTWARGDEFNQDPIGKIPGYGYLNLDSTFKISSNFSTFIKVTNVFDKQYSTYGIINNNIYTASKAYDTSSSTTTEVSPELFVTPSIPRGAWIGISYSFGGGKKTNIDKD